MSVRAQSRTTIALQLKFIRSLSTALDVSKKELTQKTIDK